MKLFILHEKEKYEVSISENVIVQCVKDKFDGILRGNGLFCKPFYKLIYRNIILGEKNLIDYYNISDNNEIWIGKLENYVKNDDVIVEVFLVGLSPSILWVIVKRNDTIESIISSIENIKIRKIKIFDENSNKLENIKIRIIKIFDENGNKVENNQIIEEIDNNGHTKVFIEYGDNIQYDNNYTFASCCEINDKYWIGQAMSSIYEDNEEGTLREYLITVVNDLQKIMSINDTIYSGFNQKLYFPLALINSGFLFCRDVTDRIIDIFKVEVKLEKQINEFDCIFWKFLDDTIMSSMYNFVNSLKDQIFEENKSYFQFILFKSRNFFNFFSDKNLTSLLVRNIIVDSLCIFMDKLHDNDNWKYSTRLWALQNLMTEINKSEDMLAKQNKSVMVPVKMSNMEFQFKVSINFDNCKEYVGKIVGLGKDRLLCIIPGKECNPKEYKLDNQCLFEIVYKLNGNFSRKVIGKGLSRIILLKNNETREQIVLKKPYCEQGEIYRDICIQNKLSSSKNLKIYSKLYLFENFICVGMEYIPNESLDSYLKTTDLSEKEILKIAYQILIQIEELHKFKIVHCDIKCGNVCIDKDGNAKIIDFGLSKDISDLSWVFSGTLRYCAPEIIKHENLSFGIDIWAFGMLLVEIVTKNIPFHQIKNNRFIFEIRSMKKYEVKPIISISKEFLQFIERCLTISSSERPTAMQLLESTVFSILNT